MTSAEIHNAGAPALQTANVAKRASGSSFYLAMRILPREQRDAMFEIYSFCRLVDDIADSDAPRPERAAGLEQWRRDIEAMYAGRCPAELRGLANAVERFKLRQQDFLAVIDGMNMDAVEDIRAPEWSKLDLYCDRVASAVGRLSVRVFGLSEWDGVQLARHLGRALQLTTILRDVDEDADIGRLYLPQEALRAAGIVKSDPAAALASPGLGAVCAEVVERARGHFDEADKVMARCSRRTVRAPRIMSQVYRAMLEGMAARGWAPPRERVRTSRLRVLGTVLRYAIV
jgi:squalene synthase HpnD